MSCLYIPNFITSQPLNHDHFFIGMEQGAIYVFDLKTSNFTSYIIEFEKLFPGQRAAPVVDIKCHTTKMHRLLLSYKDTAIVVFSLNKNCLIQTICMTEQYLQE